MQRVGVHRPFFYTASPSQSMKVSVLPKIGSRVLKWGIGTQESAAKGTLRACFPQVSDRVRIGALFIDSGCNVLCNLPAKAPFQTEITAARPKTNSLITEIHCWHPSSVCWGWKRKEMVFREPEIQEPVTLKPSAECNMLTSG